MPAEIPAGPFFPRFDSRLQGLSFATMAIKLTVEFENRL